MRRLADLALGALGGMALLLVGGAAGRATLPSATDTWRVVGVVIESNTGQQMLVPLAGAVATPVAPSPTTTYPPTPLPTNTPRSSATPTSLVTAPTPTQETTPLPPYPTTTPGVGEGKGNCLVKTGGVALNERVAPSVSAAKTATSPIPPASIVAVFEFRDAEGYLWARSVFGWFAVRQGETWWITFVADTVEWCIELPGYPPGVQPPPSIVGGAGGVWVGPGANRDELLALGYQLRLGGIQPAVTVYGDTETARLLLERGWLVALRVGTPDCPDMAQPAESSARAYVRQSLEHLTLRPQIIVLANECTWPDAAYVAAWVREVGRALVGYGVRAAVPLVWYPGSPELMWVRTLAEAYRTAPVALLWGINVYPVRAGVGLRVRDAYTTYTTWRHELYMAQLHGVPLVVTEYARGDGSEPPDWSDISAWWQQVRDRVVLATAWYVAGSGGLGHWPAANLAGQLTRLAEALVRR